MAFQLSYYSQRDPQWKDDILGFGDRSDTIGYVGCALTSVAMLLSGHGFSIDPKLLNERLKKVNGFVGAGIRWAAVSQLFPKVTLKAYIPCLDSAAPLAQIDASIAAGQPAIVMVDSAPVAGIQTHWVVLHARTDNDYLMLDPWPYQTDVSQPNPLMRRYSQGKPLQRTIKHVILYENSGAIQSPAPGPSGAARARVKADVIWGLNIRSSSNTSSPANVLETVPAGTELILLEADGEAKIGAINQWVRVRTPSGKEGVAAAWYLEKVPADIPEETPEPTPIPPEPAPVPPEPTPEPPDGTKPRRLKVVVSASGSSDPLKVYAFESTRAKVLSTQAAGCVLACVEPYDIALAKAGVKGKWLKVRYEVAKFGYVQAELVEAIV
jgi:hypothetical protein